MADKLVNVSADSANDFIDKATKKMGGDGEMGVTKYDIHFNFHAKNGAITKIKFDLKVGVTRAHWSGGKPDANNLKAIHEAEKLNKKHEEKHRKLAEEICAREFAKEEKALKGKTKSDAENVLKAIKKQVDDAYKALDKKEGMTMVKTNSDGTFTVKQVGR